MVKEVEARCAPFCMCSGLVVHGMAHLRRVAYTAGRIAGATGENVEGAIVAGFLHDCARTDEGGGNSHAHASAEIARELMGRFYPHLDMGRLCEGIARHADGTATADLLIGSIWDADRLDLRRLGIHVEADMLSTALARRILAIARKDAGI